MELKADPGRLLARFGWLAVVGAALALSAWSLYWVSRHYGAPPPVAALVSASFDGAALVSADLSLRYARTLGDSGLAARLAVFGFAGASAFLNSQHAALAHNPSAARVLYAAPPVAAVIVFELHSRWERRGALRAAGRMPDALPVFGRWAWVLYPLRTLGTLRLIIGHRLVRAEREAQGLPMPAVAGQPAPGTSLREIRVWARTQGLTVSDHGPLPAGVVSAHAQAVERANGYQLRAVEGEPS